MDTATSLKRWNQRAIIQKLAQEGKMYSDDVCQEILRVTGGWPCLLDEIFERCGSKDDPRSYVMEMERELADSGTSLFESFLASLGIEANESARRVLDFILQEEEIPQDMAESKQLAELMYEETGLLLEECEVGINFAKHMWLIELNDGVLRVEPTVGRVLGKL